jgi:hypothetical protein
MARIRNSLEKLPSGRLGEGTMKKEASVPTASDASVVARSRLRPSVMVFASNGSSTGGSPALIFRTASGLISTPRTSNPRWAKVAAMQAPSFPIPKTDNFLRGISRQNHQ